MIYNLLFNCLRVDLENFTTTNSWKTTEQIKNQDMSNFGKNNYLKLFR